MNHVVGHVPVATYSYTPLSLPLRMVASYSQLPARHCKGKLDSDADDFIGFMVDGTTRTQMLINDLLLYSRGGAPFIFWTPTVTA